MRTVLKTIAAVGAAIALVFLGSVSPGAGAAYAAGSGAYKWTDDKGVVHYSDHIPSEALNKGGVMLDKQGRAVQKIDPQLSPEQRVVRQADEDRQRAIAKQQEEQTRRDRALMQSYSSEQEIDLARNRAMSTVEAQLKSAQTFTTDLAKRQRELDQQRQQYGSKPVPAALERELAGIDEEMTRQNELIGQKKQEIGSIVARYNGDKQRWQELKQDGFTLPAMPAADGRSSPYGPPGPPNPSGAAKASSANAVKR